MTRRIVPILAVLGLITVPATAGWDKSPGGNALDRVLDQNHPHVRYPGDRAYPFGTVNVRGGKKVPYVERCYWTVDTSFFGIPRKFRQTCVRYTPQNTGLE